MLNKMDRLTQKICRLLVYSFLGMLLVFSLPMVTAIAQQSTVPLERAQRLNQQGQQQFEQGNPQAALEQWQQAERFYRKDNNQTGITGAQLNQARALQSLGFYRRARTLLDKIVTIQQQQPNSTLKASSLLMLGNILRLVGEDKPAEQVLVASLSIAQQMNSLPDIQAAYLHLGNTLVAQQQLPKAIAYFKKAAAISAPLQLPAQLRQLKLQQLSRDPEALTLLPQIEAQLATLPPSQMTVYGHIELASILSTQNATLRPAQLLAIARQQARTLGDRQAESWAIGRLAHLYEQNQQLQDAKQLTQAALQLAKTINVPEIIYQWQWQLGRILQAEGNVQQATAAYTQTVGTLQLLRKDLTALGQDVQFSFRDQVEPVYRELVDLLLQPDATQDNLKKARQVIESLQLAELNNFFREACLDATPQAIDEIDPTAAVIYPVILRDRLEVILSVPRQPLQHFATNLPQAEIEAGVAKMQASLRPTSFTKEQLAAAQQMYRWMIQPVADTLAQCNIKTLVFVLDGSLRNLPMAALHDGKQYLIEQYQIALTPGLQLLSPRPLQPKQIRALIGGVSEATSETTELPGVRQEIDEISRQLSAEVLLNSLFTTNAFNAKMQTAPFTIVHLATHGQFSSNAKETYIQTWDGKLTVDDLQSLLSRRSQTDKTAIELLVLSACETAQGDNRAALGMAGVAVRSGARSTLATLWQVNDASTAAFVTKFYETLIHSELKKAEAVREAQLTLLRSPEFKHPFYWAPFILVGNWL